MTTLPKDRETALRGASMEFWLGLFVSGQAECNYPGYGRRLVTWEYKDERTIVNSNEARMGECGLGGTPEEARYCGLCLGEHGPAVLIVPLVPSGLTITQGVEPRFLPGSLLVVEPEEDEDEE